MILRALSSVSLCTVTCFALLDGSLFHARSEIRFDGDFIAWTSYRYEDLGAGTDVRMSRADLPEVSSPVCRQLELTVDGKVQNILWVSDGAVLKSDWGGAESFLERSREQAVAPPQRSAERLRSRRADTARCTQRCPPR